jgi:Zn-dependent protease
MAETQRGSGAFRLFRAFGIEVSMHWTWLLLAIYAWQARRSAYEASIWAAAEYVSLFAIVLMHEFGHALACRSVGGRAERILLWPFGGVAFVDPPQRAGALLWSIAAGPLVNVALAPVTLVMAELVRPNTGDVHQFVQTLFMMNLVLLVFNLLPIYPLDGGQILRALLWFVMGPARSLLVAAVIGLIGAGAVLVLAAWLGDVWLVVLAVLGATQSWNGYRQARMMLAMASGRVAGVTYCPACGAAVSSMCRCGCGQAYDSLVYGGRCPRCGLASEVGVCPACGQASAIGAWRESAGGVGAAGPYVPPSPREFGR